MKKHSQFINYKKKTNKQKQYKQSNQKYKEKSFNKHK